jgi:beta-galactosidase
MIVSTRKVLRIIGLLAAVNCLSAASLLAQQRPMSLEGTWRFALDPDDSGVRTQIFNRDLLPPIKLPGILQSQNFGNEISSNTPWVLSLYDRFWYLRDDYKAYAETGKVKVPFLSQPPRHYVGVAWYQRYIEIPPNWVARRVVLTLERPHWETTVWVDGNKIGSDRSLVAPHVYDLGQVSPGRHRLTIRVDNRMVLPYRLDAHSVSDSLGGSWNGIVGRIELTNTGRVWIDDAQVFPNQKSLFIVVHVGNITGRAGAGTITAIWPDNMVVPVNWDEHGGTVAFEVPLRDEQQRWDEFHPALHRLTINLRGNGDGVDEYRQILVGLRTLRAEGKEFVLNGRPINFRGTHSGGDFPLTGYPPTDVKSWRKLFQTCKDWGLNHMRFHSWCPPEAAFEAADQLGFYLQPEPGMWNEITPGTPLERMLYEETDRMIKAYGNHPSFMLLSASNEPRGKWKDALTRWVERYRKEDPRRLYATGTGHTEKEIPDLAQGTDYLPVQRIGPMMLRRESGWFGSDYAQSLTDINVPVISHEVGQWVAYPDYDIIKKFTGYLQPGNFEIFRDSMAAHGLLEKDKQFARDSGRFQLACYKEEIEANLRTPGLGGFQLLDLHDYLGQGTALVGLLDAFWEPKSYVDAQEFREFCNTTVPLARLPKRVYTRDDSFDVPVEVAHFGAEPMENGKAVWQITAGANTVKGEWEARTIPIGKNIPLGRISADLSKFSAPQELKLKVTLGPESFFRPEDRTIVPGPGRVRGVDYFENEWTFWLYPSLSSDLGALPSCMPAHPTDFLLTSSWDEAEKKLLAGGDVLFVPRNTDLDWTSPPLDTVPVFWNRLMGPAWGRMLGLSIEPGCALNGFPTETNFDWQWAEISRNVRAVNLDRLPPQLEPSVWAIDDWNRNYKLGAIFECRVGHGRLLVSAFDITKPDSRNPVARQLRHALFGYMNSETFQPRVQVPVEQMRTLFFDTSIMKKLHAVARVDGAPENAAIDGDPNTFWLVGDQRGPVRDQPDMVIEFPTAVTMSGVVLMSRQNHREHEGDICEYALQASDDGNEWRDLARGELLSTFAPQRIIFARTTSARYLKLIALSGFGPDKTTSLAELAIIYAGPKLPETGGTIEYQRNRTATPDIDEGTGPAKSQPAKPKKPQ